MATVREKCITEEQRLCVFLWTKRLNAKDIHKEIFSVYDGKCLSRKMVRNWVEKCSQERSKVVDNSRPGAKLGGTTHKRLLCCRFRRTGKAMGQMYQCWWMICREIIFFFTYEYRMFLRFVSICDLFTLLPLIWVAILRANACVV
jgi:hypothetical protein